jgi:glycosyltransferase involved in cell wall biosynthesis
MTTKPILFFADRLPPLIGGMEMHARYFIEHFSEHTTFPLIGTITKTPAGEDCLITNENKKIIDFKMLAKAFQPALLFFNSGRWIEKLAQLRHLFPTATFLYRTGGNEILKAPLEQKIILDHKLRQAYWASILNNSLDLLITNSAFTEARLREIGITCTLARCIGGVNTTTIKQKSPAHSHNTLRLFCAARFVPYKNHSLLIKVLHELILRGHAINLRLAGDGPLFAEIKNQIKQYKLEAAVEFLGAVDNETVCQEIVDADIYIQLSSDYVTKVSGGEYIHSEGMGRSILEALSAGTFVVAGKCGALPEVVTEDKGLLVELNDLTTLTNQIEKAIKLLPINLPGTHDYSWSNLFRQYERLMARLKNNENFTNH